MKRFDTLLYAASLTAGIGMIGLNLLSAYQTMEYSPDAAMVAQAPLAGEAVRMAKVEPTAATPGGTLVDSKQDTVLAANKAHEAKKDIPIDAYPPQSDSFVVVSGNDTWTKK